MIQRRSTTFLLAAALGLVVLAGCGDDDAVTTGAEPAGDSAADCATDVDCDDTGGEAISGEGAIAMCAVDQPDCDDMPTSEEAGDAPEGVSEADEIVEARALLGVAEADLPAGVRTSRRGAEVLDLTDDYVIGRATVELDETGGAFVVTTVVVELTEGPLTITE